MEWVPALTEAELQYLRRRAEESGMGESVIRMLDNIRKKRYPNEEDKKALERMIADEQEYLSE